jgi:hypothetical protein
VYLGGRLAGTTGGDGAPAKRFEVPAGTYDLTIVAADTGVRYRTYKRKISIATGKTIELGLIRLVPIREVVLNIAGPGVVISVNGTDYQQIPGQIMRFEIPENGLRIKAVAANGKKWEKVIAQGSNDLNTEPISVAFSLE